MNNELMRYTTGDTRPARYEREIAARAKPIYDEVRLAGFKADQQTTSSTTKLIELLHRASTGLRDEVSSIMHQLDRLDALTTRLEQDPSGDDCDRPDVSTWTVSANYELCHHELHRATKQLLALEIALS